MKRFIYFLVSILFFVANTQAQVKKPTINKKTGIQAPPPPKPKMQMPMLPYIAGNTKVKITTDSGVIIIRLYDKTPKHRDNFIKLVKEKKYDSLLFHRVIDGFMIQGGDVNSKNAQPGVMLGSGDLGYTIPAEFDSTLFHKKGALCAARTDNPEKASSSCQFYLAQGIVYSMQEINQFELQSGKKLTKTAKLAYTTIGGIPFLDTDYTVYGEVVSGLKIIDKIAKAPKDRMNRPLGDIRMKMELIK